MVLEEKRKPWFKPLGKFVGGLLGGVVYIYSIYIVFVFVHKYTNSGQVGRLWKVAFSYTYRHTTNMYLGTKPICRC